VPEVTCTDWPEVIEVLEMITSVPEVPTVRPDTMAVPAEFRNSAKAAVPVADAVAESGVPLRVKTLPDTVAGVVLKVNVASTPVAPERAEVPITIVPAAVPVVDMVGAVAVPRSFTTRLSRLVLSALLYVTGIELPQN
jgi:hypothetical protein